VAGSVLPPLPIAPEMCVCVSGVVGGGGGSMYAWGRAGLVTLQ